MTIQEFLTQFGPWLLGIAALITSVAGAINGSRNSGVENVAKNVETLQKMVNELVESKDRLKKEKDEESARFNTEIGRLNEKIRVLEAQRESDQAEIHDLHALIGKEVVAKLKIQIDKD